MRKTDTLSTKERKESADKGTSTPMMVQYFEIKNKYPDYLVFYRLGDFYELFFEDAEKASKALDLVLTKRGKNNGQDIPMCGVPFHAYENYLAKLVKCGFKVAICEQVETPEEAKKRGGSSALVKREVSRLVTPGTLTESALLDAKKHNFLLSIVKNKRDYSIAWVDVSTGDFFTETDTEKKLSSALFSLEPSEVLLPQELRETVFLKETLEELHTKVTYLSVSLCSAKSAQERMESLFKVSSLESFGTFLPSELCAAGELLSYIELTQQGLFPQLMPLKKVISSEFMEIDAATCRNLELFHSLSTIGKGKSLLDIIDKTTTNGGSRLLKSFLRTPLLQTNLIEERLDSVDFFLNEYTLSLKLKEALKQVPDIERSLARLAVQRGGPRDLAAIRRVLLLLPSLKNLLLSDFTPSLIKKALDSIENFDALRSLLNRALKEEETLPLLSRDGGFIAPHFHGALDELRELKQNNRTYLSELQLKYTALTEVSGLKIGFNNLLGYYIEVPSRSAQALLDKKEVFFHRQTLKSNVRFSTAELAELEEKIKTANEKALAIELSVYEELVQKVMQNAAALQKTAGALSLIDVILGFALVAREKTYTRPLVDSSLAFEIKKGRHLVVEESLKENNASAFVENDCVMDEGNFWLMTGPNMAGKSTFLRQNALIAILAQIGCFVPAEFCHIGVIDKLFSRVGASDDLARGRSTFMVEMIETALILNQAGERSFVILDEIGRGTATFDGLSIAWAAIEYLHEVSKCRTLFATHYHELTDLKENLHRLSLHTMRTKEWQGDVIFLHEVIEGAAEHSYGIHVAKLAGLPKAVTKRAEQILSRLESKQVNKDSLLSALPLFSKVLEETKPTPPTPLEQEIRSLDPNTLSPKEALEVLYKLKNLDEKESA